MKAAEAQSAALGDILEDEPLFAAYPELREAPVIPMPGDRDKWGRAVNGYAGNGTIVLFTDKLRDQVQIINTLYHEIQHLIQDIEGFEGGEGRKVPTWSFYANAMGEAEARVAGAGATVPYGYDMDTYFRHATELTEGEIRDETGTWRRQTYDDLTFKAQRDRALLGRESDAATRVMDKFHHAESLSALAKLAKKHLDVTEMTWGPKDGGGFEVTVEYDDDTIWWNTYGSEAAARDSMRRIFLARYANRTGDARSSIEGTVIQSTKFIIAEARQAIRDQNEKNPNGYTNRETGRIAFINSTQMREMTNPNALGKSKTNGFSNYEHLHAVALAPTLYENATLVRDDSDLKNKDPHVRIMRYAAPIVIDRPNGRVEATAWLTVKTSEQHGNRVYSLELLELEEARRITANTASTALPRTRDLTDTIANPAGEVKGENAPRSSIGGWFRRRQKRLRYAEEPREDTARHAQAFAEGDRETAAFAPTLHENTILVRDGPDFKDDDPRVRILHDASPIVIGW